MNNPSDELLHELAESISAMAAGLPEHVRLVFERGGGDSKKGARVDGDAPQRVGQFLLWETGELDVQVLRRADEFLVLNEHRLVEAPDEVREALRTFVEILTYVDPRE